MTRLLIPLACMSLLGACTSTPEPASLPALYTEPPALNSMDHPLRLSATQIGGELGGAAYRARAVEDVLLRNSDDLLAEGAMAANDPPYDRLVAQLKEHNTSQIARPAAMEEPVTLAWRRYCDAGVGMTDADWQFVRNNGLEQGVPDALAENCVYPK